MRPEPTGDAVEKRCQSIKAGHEEHESRVKCIRHSSYLMGPTARLLVVRAYGCARLIATDQSEEQGNNADDCQHECREHQHNDRPGNDTHTGSRASARESDGGIFIFKPGSLMGWLEGFEPSTLRSTI